MNNLKLLIKESGLKQTYIAGKMGISRQYLSQMLSGTQPMSEEYERTIKSLCFKMVS